MEQNKILCINVFLTDDNSFDKLLLVKNMVDNGNKQLSFEILNKTLVDNGMKYTFSQIIGQWNIKSITS
jgi:hypothetical protein